MKIFLASPVDVGNYRQAAKRVADRLNEENGVKLGSTMFLEIVDWNRHIAPLMSLPESAVLERLEVSKHDVFLGIAWLGFDSLGDGAPAAQDAEGADAGPSTERNFELAFSYWKAKQPSQCLLHRCMRLPEKLTDIDGLAFDRVQRFFSRFTLGGDNAVCYSEFNSATDLEEQLASQLSQIQKRFGGAKPAKAPSVRQASGEPSGEAEQPVTREFEKRMQPGKAYEVSFLSIEIVETADISAARTSDPEGVATLFRSFKELVAGTASGYGGEIFTWSANGGLLMFWANRSYDHAIMTGLKVLHSLPVFNLDSKQNPLAVSVKTRSAAHDAVIIFKLPSSDISSEDLDFVVEMQRQNTEPAELSITRRLLELVDERLKPHFKYKGRFKGEPVHACRLPSSKREPDQANFEEYTGKLKRQAVQVADILATPAAELDISGLEALSTAIDETYSTLNKFCSSFSSIDRGWPKAMFSKLASTTLDLMSQEAEIWQTLRKCYVSGSFTAGKARKLEAIVQTASRRRSRPVVILDKLGQRCRALAGSGAEEPPAEPPSVDEDLVKKIQALVRADALDSETILTELLLNRKEGFLEYLGGSGSGEKRRRLLDKLWQTADLLLLDDLYSIRGHRRASDGKVYDALTGDPIEDGRFRWLREQLSRAELPADEQIQAVIEAAGRQPDKEDLQIVWRCLVIGHGQMKVRQAAALKLSRNSAWQAISLPNVPIASLYAIGERIKKEGSVDAEKIFFDCIRARLEHLVETFRRREEAEALTKLIMVLLDFPFLVETGYFERFDDILRKFLERAHEAGVKVEYFESLRRTLEEARQSADKSPSKPPAGIKKLPLTIQRRLAGESRYVYWFVSHPDPRIACETLRHVGLMNVERVLRLREVNQAVLAALLKKPELFTRSGPLTAALHHPKCTQAFASRYLSTMARSRQGQQALVKIANDPSANPVVRSAAKRLTTARTRARS